MTYSIYQETRPPQPWVLVLIGTVEAGSPEEALQAAKDDGIAAPIVGPETMQ